MSNTFNGSSKAVDHLYAVDLVFDFLLKNKMNEEYSSHLVPMFLNCFWFAYGNSDGKNKKKIQKKSTTILKKMDLKGDYVVESLRDGAYYNIEGIDPPLHQRVFGALFCRIAEKFGIQGSKNIAWRSSSSPDPFNYSERVATTKWVHDHEWVSGIDRWKITFDSSKSWIDWGYPDGIPGGREIQFKDFHSLVMPGHRFRFFVSFRGMDPMIIFGEVNRSESFVWGTTVYDGTDVISISVDVRPEDKCISIRGYNITKSTDCSEECKLMKIQMTV